MKLDKLFLTIENLFEELLSPGTSAHLLTKSHLLFKAIECSSLFLRLGEDAFPSIEVSVDELHLKKMVTPTLLHHFHVGLLVDLHVELDLLSEGLLDGAQLNQRLLQAGLLFHPLWRVVIFNQLVKLLDEMIHLV